MCIIVDSCALASVFGTGSKDHGDFHPIYLWIYKGKGKVILGGTKYRHEIPIKYLKILTELSKIGKAVILSDGAVDSCQKEVEKRLKAKDFNDPHLVAMVIISRCLLVCTNDNPAKTYLRMKELYPKGIKRPSIYSSIKNKNLLSDKKVVKCCL